MKEDWKQLNFTFVCCILKFCWRLKLKSIISTKSSGFLNYLFAGHALDGGALGELGPLSLAQICPEVDRAGPVVDTDLNLSI